MSRWVVIITIVLIGLVGSGNALALPGSGTQEYPWRIESLADFDEFAADPNYWSGFTRLETDVNLAGRTYTTAVIAPDVNTLDYWFQGTAFTGVFDGNAHKITNLTIDAGANEYIGLFGYSYGEVRKLGLEDVFVSGTGYYVGGLVGYSDGTITNCNSTGDVTGDRYVGVLVGTNSGSLSNCYSTGDVSGTGDYVGGLIGENAGNVSNCCSTGNVNGGVDVGGLVGYTEEGSVSNCYSTGDVSGDSSVGGLVGCNEGNVSNCYSTGDVSGYGGGLFGLNGYHGSISNCFWDTDTQTHGVTESIGYNDGSVTNVAGLHTAQMHTKSTFTSAGWDFVAERPNGTSETWKMPAGGGYPVLSFFNIDIPFLLAGSGTVTDPYLVYDANELGMVSWYPPGSYFKLTRDIDLLGIQWSVAVVPVFDGSFDGDGKRVLNMHISGGGLLGLFGFIEDGEVRNLRLEDVFVSGTGYYVGGLVGYNEGNVSNCYSIGDVNGYVGVGGLVGRNEDGNVSNCYSIGDVNGYVGVGGLVGRNEDGNVSNCYSTGNVTGYHGVGGFMGQNDEGDVSNCYSTGNVSGVENVGGLVGWNVNFGDILNCYSTGNVSGDFVVGGLVGSNRSTCDISSCYCSGDVGIAGCQWQKVCFGGLVGDNLGSVSNCYSTGSVSGGSEVGGLVAANWGDVSNCFWDIETSGTTQSDGGTGKTTAEMRTRSTFTDAGWDFVDIWLINEGATYPVLRQEIRSDLNGDGGVDMPDFAIFADHWLEGKDD